MSQKLYKLLVFLVVVSMVFALPAVALPLGTHANPAPQKAPVASSDLTRAVEQLTVAAAAVPELPQPEGGVVELPQGLKKGPTSLVIELADEPAAVVYAAARKMNASAAQVAAATRAQIARIDAAQQALLTPLSKLGATVIYRVQRTYNGIAVRVNSVKVSDIAKLPGVKAIHALVPKTLDNWHSVPLIGAPQLWDAAGIYGGADGTGVKIGVIDTGIDYIHTDFGGPGTDAAYNADDTTTITDTYNGQLLFPTAKVVGGYDFVGDAYDGYNTPQPDPDPMDCGGHGTHVSGTAAGFGVNADGSTYTGTYYSGLDVSTFKIGPGVAPKAQLYALRVFGCSGVTNVVVPAIDWAADPNGDGDFSDHLDVINMSLGANYGPDYDSDAVASDNASLVGVVVVASAGNSGDVYYVVGAPSTAERAISVAASHDGAGQIDGFAVTAPITYAGVYAGLESVAYNWLTTTLPITGKLVYPQAGSNPAQDQRTGCYTFNITNTQLISGNIVLLDWNNPSCGGSVGRTANAAAAHAIGAILVDNRGPFELAITGSPVIPAYSAPKVVGDQLKTALGGASDVMVVMTNQYQGQSRYFEPTATDNIASFSSRGPGRASSGLKPDITAPGVTIFSARFGSGTGGESLDGTSMAAPHVAGSMALLRQLHPGWSVEELKSLAMNTAVNDITQLNGAPPSYDPGRVGAGRITLPNAASSKVIAFNAVEPYLTSVSFGAVEVNGVTEMTKLIRVVNKGSSPAKYQVSYRGYAAVPGVQYTVIPAMISLPANGSAVVSVKMTADASQMKHSFDPTISTSGGRSWLSEASGYVVMNPILYNVYLPLVVKGGSATAIQAAAVQQLVTPYLPVELRVPVYAAPRPAADMYAMAPSIAFTGTTGTATIPMTGTGINTGSSYPVDIVSLATAFELAEASPNDPGPAEVDNVDLKYVGATNDNRIATGGFVTNTTLYFGVATWGDHNTPVVNDSDIEIYIDSNRDGNWDYVVYNYQTGTSSSPTDVFATAVVNLSTGGGVLDQYVNITPAYDTYPFNNNVMVMPVSARRIGLNNSNPRFDYQIVTFDRTGAVVDASALHTYSAATAGLDFTNNVLGLPGTVDLPGFGVNVAFNYAAYALNGSQGALLLHHHNAAGMREEVVDVNVPNNYASITIMHTNDFHGQLEPSGSNPGYARDTAVIKEARAVRGASNVLLLDAGDEMQGSLLSNLNKGAPVIDLFNQTGVNAATFGNHEFDWGQQVLISRTQQAAYPFVTANIVVSDTGSCSTAGWTTPSFAKPWITTTVGAPGNQVVVGIVGVTTLETPQITIASATEGLCFKDPAQSINHYISTMRTAGAQVIVVLSHLGYPDGGYGYGIPVYGDQTLARKLKELGTPADLIIGGHSHTNLAATTMISGTAIVQAYYNGRNVGRADMLVNKTTGQVTINWAPISIGNTSAWAQDPAAKARIAVWANDPVYQALINQPIGYTQVDLPRGPKTEAMMGDFIDDAIYNYLNNDSEPANDVDLFFNNAGGIRTDWCRIPDTAHPGQYIWSSNAADCHTGVYTDTPMLLTYGNMFTILPFGNATVVGKMTGAQIVEIVNYGPLVSNGVIQPAGLKYTYYAYTDTKPGPQPYAWGAYNVTVRNKNTGVYEPLVMTKTYSVGTNEFLAPAGGDGYNGFKYMTNITYWGDMLNAVNAWVTANYSTTTPYKGPNNDGTLDGRIVRNGTDTYGGTATEVVPVTLLHHNDSHGRLVPSGSNPGYTNLVTLINQERAHNTSRTLLLQAGDNIQGDAMDAFYKAAFTGKGSDGTTLPMTLTVNPVMAAFNAMNYDAMTLGNHEFNFGHYIFTGTLGQATFPLLQANLYDDGSYGIDEVNVRPYITRTLPGPAGSINLAVLGIGNHRVPQYELPSNIPGLTFTDPITETLSRVPALKAANDVVVALTHIGFTTDPSSVEVDNNVDTYLATQSTGVDAIIGGHSHTNPSTGFGPYKFLPTFVGAADGTPVIINQAYRYNTYLGEVVLGLLPKAGGGYDVVARAGRYIANSTSVAEDATMKAIVKPYDDFLTTYRTRVVGQTTLPIDTLTAYTQETNGADLQVDASLWKLNSTLPISIDFHLSGAMTNAKIAASATATNPYTMTVNDMFTLMPYENSLVAFTLNGPQLKTILERAYRNYWYYKYVPGYGGYSYYPTCNLDISAGGIITYTDDPITYTTAISHVVGLSFGNTVVDFNDASTYYNVSTVNYVAAGSCNFNNGGVTLWPLNQITYDTQNYVRDVVIEYVPTLSQPITPLTDNRIHFIPPGP